MNYADIQRELKGIVDRQRDINNSTRTQFEKEQALAGLKNAKRDLGYQAAAILEGEKARLKAANVANRKAHQEAGERAAKRWDYSRLQIERKRAEDAIEKAWGRSTLLGGKHGAAAVREMVEQAKLIADPHMLLAITEAALAKVESDTDMRSVELKLELQPVQERLLKTDEQRQITENEKNLREDFINHLSAVSLARREFDNSDAENMERLRNGEPRQPSIFAGLDDGIRYQEHYDSETLTYSRNVELDTSWEAE